MQDFKLWHSGPVDCGFAAVHLVVPSRSLYNPVQREAPPASMAAGSAGS